MTSVPMLGAWSVAPGRVRHRVWAPGADQVAVLRRGDAPVALTRAPTGHWARTLDGDVGDEYRIVVDGGVARPDPASMAQPRGLDGPSAVVDPAFPWTDADFSPPPVAEWVFSELHVGTFTAAGTFDGAIPRLAAMAELGINAVELMPIAEFPGTRNWGYDGVLPFAAHHAYGGLDGLRRFVDASHARGIAVVLDVVYNHLGPEENHLGEFGPYFTDRYHTPWGAALNFDGPASDGVREFFVENAKFWVRHAHVDGIRLDAVHAIVDHTAFTFVEELTASVHEVGAADGRNLVVIAESADDDALLTAAAGDGGRGVDAQWSDDFHHALHVALTGEQRGYYADYSGTVDLADALRHGFVSRGRFSRFRGRRHGRPAPDPALDRLVVYAQNHDQIGNRARGERLISLVGFEAAKLALAATLLGPSIPLLFMGEESAARQPFPYFISHTDPALVDAVRRGRTAEFAGWDVEPPDPQDERTFASAVLERVGEGAEADAMRALCRDVIELRRSRPALSIAAAPRPARARGSRRRHPDRGAGQRRRGHHRDEPGCSAATSAVATRRVARVVRHRSSALRRAGVRADGIRPARAALTPRARSLITVPHPLQHADRERPEQVGDVARPAVTVRAGEDVHPPTRGELERRVGPAAGP